jgi:hypothetical protein
MEHLMGSSYFYLIAICLYGSEDRDKKYWRQGAKVNEEISMDEHLKILREERELQYKMDEEDYNSIHNY